MSLRSIHLLFIASSIALAVLTAIWGVTMYTSGRGDGGHALFAVGSLLTGVLLAAYLVRFVRKTREIGME